MNIFSRIATLLLVVVLASGSTTLETARNKRSSQIHPSIFFRSLRRKRQIQNQSSLLSDWSPWTACSVTNCNITGEQRRQRKCIGNETTTICLQALAQIRVCSKQCGSAEIEDTTRWASWTNWSSCSVSCGQGAQFRDRRCLRTDERPCSDHTREERMCRMAKTCPSWKSWSPWSSCSKSCGNGTMQRKRECVVRPQVLGSNSSNDANILRLSPSAQLDASFEVMNDSQCSGGREMAEETQTCVLKFSCNSSRQWSTWQRWSRCSKTCGRGYSYRIRKCGSESGGCVGQAYETRLCYSPPCWSSWSSYSRCSVNCNGGFGLKFRTRKCLGTTNRIQSYAKCNGLPMSYATCTTEKPCPMWGAWGEFSMCSKSCNEGEKTRTRKCLQEPCYGPSVERQSCNFQRCPTWSTWTSFSCCSVSCGEGGVKTRSRRCKNGYPGVDGCPGNNTQSEPCASRSCNTSESFMLSSMTCGVRYPLNSKKIGSSPKIIGGTHSQMRGWPWHGSWQHYDCVGKCSWKHLCGATLIAPQWVVTAGHCTEEIEFHLNHEDPGEEWSVVIGMNKLYVDGTRYHLSRVFVHSNYSLNYITTADIALIKLRWPVPLTRDASPLCLPNINEKPRPGETCYVTGWDGRGGQAQTGLQLLKARVPILAFEQCRKLGVKYEIFLRSKHHLCAGDPVTAATDTCNGDSGGPLACQRSDNTWYLAGVTSFGFECAKPGHVGVYVPMNSYEGWIRDVLTNNTRKDC